MNGGRERKREKCLLELQNRKSKQRRDVSQVCFKLEQTIS